MPWLFAVSLLSLKVVDGGAYALPGSLVRAKRTHLVTDHQQGLKRHHHFVVFEVIAGQHEDFFSGQVRASFIG